LLGQSESAEKVRTRQQFELLLVNPLNGLLVLAYWTVPVPARRIRNLNLPAMGALEDMLAAKPGATLANGGNDPTMRGGDILREAFQV
jgi:hypothetical protein